MGPTAVPRSPVAIQPSLEDLGVPLREVTFVVVDLETTGGRAGGDAITEIGAVKVRGGEVVGEFQTLVNPGVPVPAQITVLTGITNAMVLPAPRIDEVLPAFLEFVRGAVLVAHNAPFDIGFLKAAARATGHPWPGNQVIDTVRIARATVTRDEVPNYKLSTLAGLFRASVTPDHRALSDARATVDVLHALLGRLAGAGVTHLEDLATAGDNVPMEVRRKRHLADVLPEAPGVYLFVGPSEEVLYVGTSKNLRSRVRTYFTAAETRKAIKEMVRIAHDVRPVVCATELEAQVRELRLIAEHSPRYNKRSKFPQRTSWIRLVETGVPRLSVVREVVEGAAHLGPFASRSQAQLASLGLLSAFRPAVPGTRAPMHVTREDVEAVRRAMLHDPHPIVAAHVRAIAAMTEAENFEAAAALRDRLSVFLRGASRVQRLAPLAANPE
ncbi:MAG: DEDD exonuclease domain-containing protein, partial [Actinomycetota bacterium]|nr:DEDD exonuclease domain-containing protein [Actinomycetota bacterium]